MTTHDGQRPFIEKVASDTREYIQSLLDENQRLAATLADVATRERMLQERVTTIEEESRRFSARFVEVEQQNTDLANLYVASYQLHGTLDRQRVLNAVQEIVINLIGSEELAILELEGGGHDVLTLAASVGIDRRSWAAVPIDRGIVGLVARTGERFVNGTSTAARLTCESSLTACIPLKLDHRVIGVIAIFGLLPQKEGLAPVDFELFDLLATHAATALFCTRLQRVMELIP
jgi:hypothetical protein